MGLECGLEAEAVLERIRSMEAEVALGRFWAGGVGRARDGSGNRKVVELNSRGGVNLLSAYEPKHAEPVVNHLGWGFVQQGVTTGGSPPALLNSHGSGAAYDPRRKVIREWPKEEKEDVSEWPREGK